MWSKVPHSHQGSGVTHNFFFPSGSSHLHDPSKQVCAQVRATLVAQTVKRLPAMQETGVWSLGWEEPLEKEMAAHSSTLAWKIPWTEEHGRLQSMGSQRVGHDWATSLHFITLVKNFSADPPGLFHTSLWTKFHKKCFLFKWLQSKHGVSDRFQRIK